MTAATVSDTRRMMHRRVQKSGALLSRLELAMWEWIQAHSAILLTISAAMFVASVVVMIVLLIRMPKDYFLHAREPPWEKSHPVLRISLAIARNVCGAFFLLTGFTMLFTPGQGILAILVAITLLDLPGKRRLELSIVRREPVHKAINWIRAKAHRPPLELPPND